MNSSSSRIAGWSIWMVATIFYAYQYVLRVLPNIMIDDILQQFEISAAAFGQISGIYYIGYSLAHLPLGILLDRYGPRKVMIVCLIMCMAGLMPFIYASHWIYPFLGRLCLGIGSSAAILCVFKIIRFSFREERFSRMLSFSVMIGLLGAIYGGAPVNLMRETFGYANVIQAFAVLGILIALASFFMVPDVKNDEQKVALKDILSVFSNFKVIASCLCAGLMVGPLEGFADAWGTVFLKEVYGFDEATAASLPSMIFIGMCFGAPLLSFIAEKTANPLGTIIIAGLAMSCAFIGLLTFSLSSVAISVIFVLVGICCSYQILAIYNTSTYVNESSAGLTVALANMIIMLFGYVFHSMIGSIVNKMGGASNPEALIYGLSIIPVGLCFGTVGFTVLWKLSSRRVTHVI